MSPAQFLKPEAVPNHELVEGKFTWESIFDTARSVVAKRTAGMTILDPEAESRIPKPECKCRAVDLPLVTHAAA